MQTPRTDLFPEALLVARSGQRIYTTSRKVAEYFGKNHFHVLRDIEKLLTDMAEMEATESNFGFSTAPNFGASTYTDSTGRSLPEYHLSHDGFALLAMGFTGREALRWKVAFLQAFRQHEADLADLQAQVYDALFPAAAPLATPPVVLRLECCLNPAMSIGHVAQALPDALDALRSAGVSVQALRVEQRGLGDAYLDALERALSIPVTALAR